MTNQLTDRLFRILFAVGCLTAGCGCTAIEKLPAGAQMQSSTFGLRVSPQPIDGSPLTLGSHTTIITTAQPSDAGPNLNRFEGAAPGVHLKSTVATGPVGEQLREMGGPDAVRALVSPATAPPVTTLPSEGNTGSNSRPYSPPPNAASAERGDPSPFE